MALRGSNKSDSYIILYIQPSSEDGGCLFIAIMLKAIKK